MRIWTTTVADDGTRELARNAERIEAAESLVARAARDGAALVVLPAGFLRARKASDVPDVAARLTRRARSAGVVIVVGVDACAAGAELDLGRCVDRGSLPFFVVASGTSGRARTWRQRSTSSADGGRVADVARRTIAVGEREIDVLACGEVWSPRLRTELGPWSGRVVVAPSHAAAGARFWAARRWADGEGARLVRAVHASQPAAVAEGAPAWDDGPAWLRAWSIDA